MWLYALAKQQHYAWHVQVIYKILTGGPFVAATLGPGGPSMAWQFPRLC